VSNELYVSNDLTITVERCWVCGVTFGFDKKLHEARSANGHDKGFYCTNGCHLGYGESMVTKLEREKAALKAAKDQACAAAREARIAQEKAEQSHARLKKRIKNGVCPCCQRSFQNLHRHLKTKHPTYATEPAK
jgi:hypothetical protein